jgi:L-threonylcarbamoyladenylate synthase
MKLVDQFYVKSNKQEIIEAIQSGKIFIYPTDTIYGIGANARLENSVNKIRNIKKRDKKTMSILAPSKEWIETNGEVDRATINKYLPGPYTLWLNKKGSGEELKGVNLEDATIWVRIPDHWFTPIIQEAGVPFITTSVNISGEPHMEKIEDVPQEILDQVDYVIYEGEKKGKRSEKVALFP